MKITIIGSHSVGKTTLCQRLRNVYSKKYSVNYIEEISRAIVNRVNDNHYFKLTNNTLLKQFLIMLNYCTSEIGYGDEKYDINILDRSLLDHWAYTITIYNSSFSDEVLRQEYEAVIHEYMKSFDFIFYIPIELGITDDDVRETERVFQKNIDTAILDFLEKYNVRYDTIRGSLENRVAQVEKLIKL